MLKVKKKKISFVNVNLYGLTAAASSHPAMKVGYADPPRLKVGAASGIKKGENLSRFVIDLKKEIEEKERAAIEKSNKKFNIKKYNPTLILPLLMGGKKRVNEKYTESPVQGNNLIIRKSIGQKIWDFFTPYDQIFFISLGKLTYYLIKKSYRFIYNICYRAGWLLIFLARLVYFLILRLTKFLNSLASWAGKFEVKAEKIKSAEKKDSIIIQKRNFNFFPRFQQTFLKQSLIFLVALLLITLPFGVYSLYKSSGLSELKGKVLGASEEALSNLKLGAESAANMDFNGANNNFSISAEKFLEAQNDLSAVNDILFSLASLALDKNLRLAAESKNILAAGEKASLLAGGLSLTLESLFNNKKGDSLKIILDNFTRNGQKAIKDANELNAVLDKIDASVLPDQYVEQFNSSRDKAKLVGSGLKEFIDLADKLKIFFAANDSKRYLLVFQNNAELRASGGFIGSFALIDIHDGQITNIEAPGGGSYDTEAGLKERISAPDPLHLVNPVWHFWDANWWPDWPTTAKKLEWFYEKSDGPTVDGVISLTPKVVEGLLEAFGPIDLKEKYGLEINNENFWLETQRLSEQKPDITKEPKKIIGDLMAKIMEELPGRLNKNSLISLAKNFQENLSAKQILFYFNNEELEKKISEYGLDGKIKEAARDYLMVVNTNIGGGKSDRKIKQLIEHSAQILEDGTIINTLKIERLHTAVKNEEFSGVRNVDWMRIYVPKGSELIEDGGFQKPDSSNFEKTDITLKVDDYLKETESAAIIHPLTGTKIYEEAGKTVFANWSMVDPGETAIIYLKYKLPFKLVKENNSKLLDLMEKTLDPTAKDYYPYSILVQKQPGSENVSINSNLKLLSKERLIWRYPKGINTESNGWQISEQLNTDKYWAVIIEN